MSILLEDQAACTALTIAFAYYADRRMYREVADLFTEDGSFRRPGLAVDGRTQLYEAMKLRPGGVESRHFCTAPMFLSQSDAAAEAVTYFTMFVADAVETGLPMFDAPSVVGEYRDRFVKTSEGWRIASRETAPTMVHRTPA